MSYPFEVKKAIVLKDIEFGERYPKDKNNNINKFSENKCYDFFFKKINVCHKFYSFLLGYND